MAAVRKSEKYCATCIYWKGNRRINGNDVVFDNVRGECTQKEINMPMGLNSYCCKKYTKVS